MSPCNLFPPSTKTSFAGFSSFSSDGSFLTTLSTTTKPRRLEFIGDSDTAGYCAEGNPEGEHVLRLTENAYFTWAVQLSQYFHAEPIIEAISGIGVLNNGGIKQYWRRTIPALPPSAEIPQWDFTSWIPDAVILLIGPNDGNFETSDFIRAYLELMEDIVDAYYNNSNSQLVVVPKIIHVCGGSGNGLDPCASIQDANAIFNSNRTDGFEGFYTSMSEEGWHLINNEPSFLGCSAHYNQRGHARLAEEIRPQIAKIMGW